MATSPEEKIQMLEERLKLLQANEKKVMAVSVKLPPFWLDKPSVWFGQVEAQFEIAGITQDRTKYNYIISTLDSKTASEVADIIENPPQKDCYEYLKAEMLKRLSASREERVRRLLGNEDIGDRKPSQFLRHLRCLAGTVLKNDDIIRQLWIRRLPNNAQVILAAQEDLPLEKAADIADKIVEVTAPMSVQSVQSPSSAQSSEVAQLTLRVEALTRSVESLMAKSRSRSTSRNYDNDRSRSTSKSSPDICWYHRRFGKSANRCTMPCKWKQENSNSDQ